MSDEKLKSEMSYFNQNDIVCAYSNQFKCVCLDGKFKTKMAETRQSRCMKCWNCDLNSVKLVTEVWFHVGEMAFGLESQEKHVKKDNGQTVG